MLFLYLKYFLIQVIKIYQKTLSPDHGIMKKLYPYGYCRFYPSCSEYSIKALEKYGLLKGLGLSFWRILRCNPWSKGGIDDIK